MLVLAGCPVLGRQQHRLASPKPDRMVDPGAAAAQALAHGHHGAALEGAVARLGVQVAHDRAPGRAHRRELEGAGNLFSVQSLQRRPSAPLLEAGIPWCSRELDVAQPGEVGMNAPAVFGQSAPNLRGEGRRRGVAELGEEFARLKHTVAPRLGLRVKNRSCLQSLLQHQPARAGAPLVNSLGGAPEEVLASARGLDERHVGQLEQRDAQEARDLENLSLPLDPRGHRRTAHMHTRGVGLLLRQCDRIESPFVYADALERADLVERLAHRAGRVAPGRGLQPFDATSRSLRLCRVRPVDGLSKCDLTDCCLDRRGHCRFGRIKGISGPAGHAPRTGDHHSALVQPETGGLAKVVGMSGFEGGDREHLRELLNASLVELLQADV